MFYAKGIDVKDNNGNKIATNGTMSVYQHCIDVGLVCNALLNIVYCENVTKFLAEKLKTNEENVISCFSYFAALHDIGKTHLYFQAYFDNAIDKLVEDGLIFKSDAENYRKMRKSSNNPYRIRHEVVSRRILFEEFKEFRKNPLFKGLCFALSSHHEKDTQNYNRGLKNRTDDFFKQKQNELISNLKSVFPFDIDKLNSFSTENTDIVCTVFLVLLFWSDWIASSDYFSNQDIEFFNNCVENKEIDEYVEKRSKSIIEVLKENLGQISENKIDLTSYNKIFNQDDYILRPVQQKIEEICKERDFKFMLIEAPMGEGKTESGLFVAGQMMMHYKKQGIYFALPTGATSDMMYDRIKDICKNQGISELNILHSTSFLADKLYESDVDIGSKTFNDKARLLASTRTGLFVPNGVGTVDQAMMAVLKSKFAGLRLLGLMNKVLIIDEIHAYDAFMEGPIHILLNWCNALDIPVVLLSATLPKKARKSLVSNYMGKSVDFKYVSYPLITCVTDNGEVVEYEVDSSFMKKNIKFHTIRLNSDMTNLRDAVLKEVQNGKNIAIICNTIAESLRVKQLLKDIPDYEIILLHSNFKVKDRAEKEGIVKKKLGKNIDDRVQNLIVIGTQVLEQSLDIDFDCMFTYLCPIDLLLQRIGRWHRFNIANRKDDPTVYVILPEEKHNYDDVGYQKIYHKFILKQTEDYILENPTCILPNDFRKSIGFVYDAIKSEDEDYIKKDAEDSVFLMLGESQAIKVPQGDKFQRTIISDFMQDNVEFEIYSTRMGTPKKKIILMDKSDLTKKDLAMLPMVKGKEFAKELLNNSVSVYYDKFGDKVIEGGSYIELEGMLKGYSLFLMDNDFIVVETEKGKILTYTYSKENGFIVEK